MKLIPWKFHTQLGGYCCHTFQPGMRWPCQVTNCWLVLYTWLQHTDVDIPHYDKAVADTDRHGRTPEHDTQQNSQFHPISMKLPWHFLVAINVMIPMWFPSIYSMRSFVFGTLRCHHGRGKLENPHPKKVDWTQPRDWWHRRVLMVGSCWFD